MIGPLIICEVCCLLLKLKLILHFPGNQHSPGYGPAVVHNHRSKYPGIVPFRPGSPSSPTPADESSLPQLLSVHHTNYNTQHKSGTKPTVVYIDGSCAVVV